MLGIVLEMEGHGMNQRGPVIDGQAGSRVSPTWQYLISFPCDPGGNWSEDPVPETVAGGHVNQRQLEMGKTHRER